MQHPKRIFAGLAMVLVATWVVLDTFDLPSRARKTLRPVVMDAFDLEERDEDEAAAAIPPRPRWEREVVSTALPLDQADRWPAGALPADAAVALRRVRLDGVTRTAVEGPVPHRYTLRVEPSADAELWLSLNQQLSPLAARGVRYRVRSLGPGAEVTLLDEVLPARHRGWKGLRADLSALGPGAHPLAFEATLVAPRGDTASSATVWWGDLRVRSRADTAQPDIAVVLIDTLRSDHLGAYGYPRPTSPYLDRLAAEGVRFEQVVASAPWTDPSVLSVMTGLYPRDVWKPAAHLETAGWRIPDTVHTLATELSGAGYHTIAASDHPSVGPSRFGAGFDVFGELYHEEVAYAPGRWRKTDQRKLLARVEALLASRAAGPGFVYLHLLYPHRPLDPPPGYLEAVGAPSPGDDPTPGQHSSEIVVSMEQERDRYDAEIRVADDVVRQFHALLREAGWDEDLVLVVLSDHGEGFEEHGYQEHGNSLYNELLRVPLIVHAPGRVPSGRVVDALVRQVDVFPTLLELAGAAPLDGIRGASLLPLLDDEGGDEARLAYSEFPHSRIVEAYAVQTDSVKRIIGDPKLAERSWFDLRADGAELHPVEAPSEAVGALVAGADAIRAAHPAASPAPSEEMSREKREMLETLGYIDD